MKRVIVPSLLMLLVSFLFCLELLNADISNETAISGTVREGYRVLTVPAQSTEVEYTVYRGDYLKFELPAGTALAPLSIPALAIDSQLTADLSKAPYFKMKQKGSFPFTIGSTSGIIEVIEYQEARYQALGVHETAKLIENISPFILDVRTPFEYANGHLPDSTLIPVQELQQRKSELSAYQNEPILIYCATGNRSTVAAKILIDSGFTQIYNMRDGIHVWAKEGLPVVH